MAIVTSLVGGVVSLAVGLLVGGLGIYVGAALVVGEADVWTAVWAALFTAAAASVVAVLVGWIPLFGGLLSFVIGVAVYLAVVRALYDATWVEAGAVALVAWVATRVATWLLGLVLAPLGLLP